MDQCRIGIDLLPLFRQQLSVREVSIRNLTLDTDTLIPNFAIAGAVTSLDLDARTVYWGEQKARLNSLRLSDTDLFISWNDDPKDTVEQSSPIDWLITLNQLELDNVNVGLCGRDDSLDLHIGSGELKVRDLQVDLGKMIYSFDDFQVRNGQVGYRQGSQNDSLKCLDVHNIALTDLYADCGSTYYSNDSLLIEVKKIALKEQCGLELRSLQADAKLVNGQLSVDQLAMQLPQSHLKLSATLPIDWLQERTPSAPIKLLLDGKVSKNDLFMFSFIGDVVDEKLYPDSAFTCSGYLAGSVDQIKLDHLLIAFPGRNTIQIKGMGAALQDSLQRTWSLYPKIRVGDLSYLKPLASQSAVMLPLGVELSGKIGQKKHELQTDLQLSYGKGKVELQGGVNLLNKKYKAEITVDSFPLNAILAQDSLRDLSMRLALQGRDWDFYKARTQVELEGELTGLAYKDLFLKDLKLKGTYDNRNGNIRLQSLLPEINMDWNVDMKIDPSRALSLQSSLNVAHLDLAHFRLTDTAHVAIFRWNIDGETDLKDNHHFKSCLSNLKFLSGTRVDTMKSLYLEALMDKKQTSLIVSSGDLQVSADAQSAVKYLIPRLNRSLQELTREVKAGTFQVEDLPYNLPDLHLSIVSGDDNPIANLLKMKSLSFDTLHTQLNINQQYGISGFIDLHSLQVDTIVVDTLAFRIRQDSLIRLSLHSNKLHGDSLLLFATDANVMIGDTATYFDWVYKNGRGVVGVNLGAEITRNDSLCKIFLYPDYPTVAFTTYKLNENPYLTYNLRSREIRSNIILEGEMVRACLFVPHKTPYRVIVCIWGLNRFRYLPYQHCFPIIRKLPVCFKQIYHTKQ